MVPFKYLPRNLSDEKWGLTVLSVGSQTIQPNSPYPPRGHDEDYQFNVAQGRVLNEYQILYIASGAGKLETKSAGKLEIRAGDAFLLFPGEWHTYYPNESTGWTEYWIGFSGRDIDSKVANGFFDMRNPVRRIGFNADVVHLYIRAIEIAAEQQPYFQQLLAGYVNHILGLAFVMGAKLEMGGKDEIHANLINKAKLYMEEHVHETVEMEQISTYLNKSYSNFRSLFKLYTGTSPAKYFIGLKIHKAQQMLALTDMSIMEIAYKLSYDTPEYFSISFKRVTGMTPGEYRKKSRCAE